MPNNVTNKLTFDPLHADTVFKICCPHNGMDFNTLIPQPLQVYQGNISSEDETDFTCNWKTWNLENWGTKWNAYDSICTSVYGDDAAIIFNTAWSIPYPVIVAFANRFEIPFEHRYFDEGYNFWGIETWTNESGVMRRSNKRYNKPEDKETLSKELKNQTEIE